MYSIWKNEERSLKSSLFLSSIPVNPSKRISAIWKSENLSPNVETVSLTLGPVNQDVAGSVRGENQFLFHPDQLKDQRPRPFALIPLKMLNGAGPGRKERGPKRSRLVFAISDPGGFMQPDRLTDFYAVTDLELSLYSGQNPHFKLGTPWKSGSCASAPLVHHFHIQDKISVSDESWQCCNSGQILLFSVQLRCRISFAAA